MAQPLDPTAHPALQQLEQNLRQWAGDAAFRAGVAYQKKGLVKKATVAGTTAHATVTGSTDYRVTISFGEEPRVRCTCPAHRRSKYCKHVVAVCTQLLTQPESFTPVDPAPEVAGEPGKGQGRRSQGSRSGSGSGRGSGPGSRSRRQSAAQKQAQLRAAGLATLDRLLVELAEGGLLTLGSEKAALLEQAGELVRSLKLRRLGNRIMALQRAAARQMAKTGPTASDPMGEAGPQDYAQILADLHFTQAATRAHLEGQVTLDPQWAEDLLGKTWRDKELETVQGLDLIPLAHHRTTDGEFQIEAAYLIDRRTGTLYAEKQITPIRLAGRPPTVHRVRLEVDEAGLYPGPSPRRIKLRLARRVPLSAEHVDEALGHLPNAVAELRRRLVERLEHPFGDPILPVAFRPAALVVQGEAMGALDTAEQFLPLECPTGWPKELPTLLPEPGRYALFGLLRLAADGLRLRCLSVLSGHLRWSRGPLYPDETGIPRAERR